MSKRFEKTKKGSQKRKGKRKSKDYSNKMAAVRRDP